MMLISGKIIGMTMTLKMISQSNYGKISGLKKTIKRHFTDI
jgi:hypothetical protein